MNNIEKIMRGIVQRYSHERYWKYRNIVINKENNEPKAIKEFLLYRIKRMDAFNNASMGTHINQGAVFDENPHFPHGINGIIVSHNAHIGRNCTIFHQVTIGENDKGAPVIGDNCLIGAGAKIIGNISIGNNVKIGAGAVVFRDIPDNCTVVINEPRIILNKSVGKNRF